MKFLLTSAGLKNSTLAKALSNLANKPLSELNLLFVPTAANTEGEDKSWLINNLIDFQNQNFKSIDILDIAAVSNEIWMKRFKEKDVICFGGGNEKYLAEIFAKVGMKDILQSSLNDKIYMGISAGSMVVGEFMPNELYPKIFPEEDFGPTTKEALGIFSFCFIPHLNSNFFTHIRKETLEEVKNVFTGTVYSTDDETALVIDENKLEIIGEGESWVSIK